MTENVAKEKILKVALVGIGGMGFCHYGCYDDIPGAKIVAVCDVRTEMAEDKIRNHAKERKKTDLPTVYADLDEMLDRETPDVVDICTPSFLHADMAVKCLSRGIHVLSEKPLTLSAADAGRVLEAAEKSGKKFMAAHVVRFMRPYVYLREVIESGKYGSLERLDMKRLSGIPLWSWEDWMRHEDRSGGVGFDLSVHDLDFVFSVLGKPEKMQAIYRPIRDNSSYIVSTLTYPNITVTCEGGWFNAAYPFRSDFLAVFANGYVRYENGVLSDNGESVALDAQAKKQDLGINISGDNAYADEIAYFLNCVRNDLPVTYVTPESVAQTVGLTEELIRTAQKV